MPSRDFSISTLVAVTAAIFWSPALIAQNDMEFTFDDEEGHLILRFVGLGPEGISESQRQEVLNAELSSMVHDHLRADVRFETEAIDAEWAIATEQHIAANLPGPGADFAEVVTECRSESCRIRLKQAVRWSMTEHQERLDNIQTTIQHLIDAVPGRFSSTYLIAAYEKLRFAPEIKIYLPRSEARE
jgi:hypothetical protein